MIRVGDRVRLTGLPPRISSLPPETQEIFRFCLGRTYLVADVDQDNELFVLDVSNDIDSRFGGFMNDIRVEQEFLEPL